MHYQMSSKVVLAAALLLTFSACTIVTSTGTGTLVSTASTTVAATTDTGHPTSFLVPTHVLTSTSIPTLQAADAYRLLEKMLRDDSRCRLPCWLGITPGTSTALDVHSQWTPLLGAAAYPQLAASGDGRIAFDQKFDDLSVSINTAYYVDPVSKIIKSIRINTQALREIQGGYEDAYGSQIYEDMLQNYMLANVLSTYGVPTQVALSTEITSAEPNSPDFFRLWLLYPEQGVILRYSAPAQVIEETIRGCPSGSFVDIWLLPVGDSDSYQRTLYEITESPWQSFTPPSPYFKSIEDSTGLSLDEFYQTYKEPTDHCLGTPTSIWPLH